MNSFYRSKNLLFLLFFAAFSASIVNAKVVGSVTLSGKTYYADVLVRGSSAEIWFRVTSNACSADDFLAMRMKAEAGSLVQAGRLICKGKEVYDSGKGVVGCLSAVGSAVCALASTPTAGATAFLCSASISYAGKQGIADCLEMLGGKIASYLGMDTEWAAAGAAADLAHDDWESAIERAIDMACSQL